MNERYKALEIFKGWLQRDRNFTAGQARREVALIDLNVKDFSSRDQFVSYSRKGSTISLNRRKRIELFMTFENAQNHASVECNEMMGKFQ